MSQSQKKPPQTQEKEATCGANPPRDSLALPAHHSGPRLLKTAPSLVGPLGPHCISFMETLNQVVGVCWADQRLLSSNLTSEGMDVRLDQGQGSVAPKGTWGLLACW